MQKNSKAYRTPTWRKIVTITLLPLITFIWTTGWILTQLGSQEEHTKIKQKTSCNNSKIETHEKDTQKPHEDSEEPMVVYKQELIAK
jgi:hypothetical protein